MLIVVSVFLFFNHGQMNFLVYHLPYVVNFKSEKIIFGLSNLQMNRLELYG